MSARGKRAAPVVEAVTLDDLALTIGARYPIATGTGWLLVHGDCLDVLPLLVDGYVQVTLTDPPYEAEAHTEQRRQKGVKITPGGDDEYREVNDTPLSFGAITAEQRAAVAVQIARVTAHRALAFCQAEAVAAWRDCFNSAGIMYRRALAWTKPDAMPSLHGRWPGQGFESIVLAQHPSSPPAPVGGAARVYTRTRDGALYSRAGASAKAPHPTTKPLPLMLQIVEDFTDAGDLVLDCYAGSATTGIACLQRGRMFIGIERDPEFFDIACRRLRGDEARPRPEQPSLFQGVGAP